MSSTVEQIKSRLSVTDVVQSYIKLQKAGANFKASALFTTKKHRRFRLSRPPILALFRLFPGRRYVQFRYGDRRR